MADFSSAATEISDSGAGSNPVVEQRVPFIPNQTAQAFAQLGQTLAEGVKGYLHQKQVDTQNAVIGQYAQKQAVINQALDQGTISPQEAHARSNALSNESIAAYPALAEQLGKVHSVFKASTSLGDADASFDATQKQAQAVKAQQDSIATSQGWILPTDPNDPARDIIINASQASKKAESDLAQQKSRWDFENSKGIAQDRVQDRERKEQSNQLVNQIWNSQSDGIYAQLSTLREQAQSGKITWEAAQFSFQKILSDTNGVIQSAAVQNPELATPYRGLVDGIGTLAKTYLDPSKSAEEAENAYKLSITNGKIAAIADPQVRALAVTSAILGGNQPILQATSATAVVNTVTRLTNTTVSNGQASGFAPQMIGNPEVESDAFKTLKAGVDNLKGGKIKNADQAVQEGSNMTNNILIQTGKAVDSGNAAILKPAADFFASSQFLYLQQKGQLDPASLQAAKKTFQVLYEPAVRQSIGTQINTKVNVGDQPVDANTLIDVKMVNGAPTFVPKANLSAEAATAANAKIKGLTQYQQGLNTVVRIGAHMEGTSDYQKYWEDNKYVLLPQLYPVKPGQVVGGFKWSGNGDWRDKSTWSKAGANG
jgi:hypothetical protein